MVKVHVMITPKETSLIRGIAKGVYRECCPLREAGSITKDELYHYGIIGLLETRQKYDRLKNVPWLEYAAYRVRGAMMDEIRKQPMIRLPQERQKTVKELKQAKTDFVRNGENRDVERLAGRLGWSVQKVHEVANLPPSFRYVDAEQRDGDGNPDFRGEILIETGDDPETVALKKERSDLVNRCLEALSPRDRIIIESRILEGLTLREVSKTLGCTPENVRLLQKKAERMMKIWMKKQDGSMS